MRRSGKAIMGEAIEQRRAGTDDDGFAAVVADVVACALGGTVDVESATRAPSPFATLFPADVITVTLGDGRELRLFLKHLGPEQADQPDKQRRDRELRVYELLLANGADHADLPVARYFGSRWNDRTQRHELFLEYIDDWPLRYHSLEHWFNAARRLAHLHAHFANLAGALSRADFLLKLDEAYFAAWARRAVAAVAEQSAEPGRRMERLCAGYDPACNLLAIQPPTLVHNDLACKNVLADRSQTPARICIIDWELAGVGCGLLDLVHLKYGLNKDAEQQMLSTYRSELLSSRLLPHNEGEFARLLAACELHKTLYRLAHSPRWNLPPATISQWVDEAELFLRWVIEA
jgi:aminoglycoside phosphotransferase (APT) family kinase protein